MRIFNQKKDKIFTLQAIVKDDKKNNIIESENHITEFVSEKQAFIYFGKEITLDKLKVAAKIIAASKREYQIDVKSFTSDKVHEAAVIWTLLAAEEFLKGQIYNQKKNPAKFKFNNLIHVSTKGKKLFAKAKKLEEAKTYTRNLQTMAPNELNSVTYANKIKKDFADFKNISVQILNKKQIKDLKMGLLLSVNAGSAYEPRVVILKYRGDKKSKEQTALVGKGVTFDAGGYNLKPARALTGMKYDMSGSAVVAGTMMAIAELKPKSNVTGMLMLTDNMISPSASTPDAVFRAMNGKSVEINNTDAEGRLALADGLTYAADKLKATRLIDIATLTGAVISALGSTYTGAWSTTEKGWKDISKAAKVADELVWRMPLHKDFFKFMSGSKVADMFNTDLSGKGGSSSAAMFLSQFTQNKEFIHLDIAGTADISHVAQAPMVRTLFELINK